MKIAISKSKTIASNNRSLRSQVHVPMTDSMRPVAFDYSPNAAGDIRKFENNLRTVSYGNPHESACAQGRAKGSQCRQTRSLSVHKPEIAGSSPKVPRKNSDEMNYTKEGLPTTLRNQQKRTPQKFHTRLDRSPVERTFRSALRLFGLSLGCALVLMPVLASTSGNLTTIDVTNVGPATVFAGAQKVAIYSFTIQVKPGGAKDTVKDVTVRYAGDNTADVSSVYLYRESGSIPGNFNAAQDILLASTATATTGEFYLDPANFTVNAGTTMQFYVVVDLSPGAVDGSKIDFQILADKITFSATWPPASEVSAGTWNPADYTTILRPSLSIDNAILAEGNSGSTNAIFTVSLSTASTEMVTVNFATVDGSATAPADYTAQSGTLTFSPGQTSKQIIVPVNGDTANEIDEGFFVTLSNATNATIATVGGTGTILNDDAAPTVSFTSPGSSGSESTTAVNLPVSLSAASGQPVTVNYTVTGTATGGGVDYTLANGTLTFAPGVTTQNVSITVVNDTRDEDNETVQVTLSDPANANLGAIPTHTYTIFDNDPIPSLSINNVTVTEGNSGTTSANFSVSLSAASGKTVTVNYATADGTAVAPTDYVAIPITTLTFSPGETNKTISVVVNGDVLDEANKTFNLNLSSPVNATLATAGGIGTITDDDLPPAVSLSLSSSPLAEAGGVATVTASLSAPSGQLVTVSLAFSGTATLNSDYTISGASIVIPPGGTNGSITLTAVQDAVDETDETIVVSISSVTNGAESGTQATTPPRTARPSPGAITWLRAVR